MSVLCTSWTVNALYTEMDDLREWRLAVLDGDDLVGVAGVKDVGAPIEALYQLFVRPEWRRKGIGSRIVEQALELAKVDGAKAVSALVAHGCPVEFYAQLGFKAVGVERERVVMVKRL